MTWISTSHSMYAIEGDKVYVVVKTHKKKWNEGRGKGITTKRSSKGVVVAANNIIALNKYKVKLDNSPNEMWVSVNALMSLTWKKEKSREKVSGMLSLSAGINYTACTRNDLSPYLIGNESVTQVAIGLIFLGYHFKFLNT